MKTFVTNEGFITMKSGTVSEAIELGKYMIKDNGKNVSISNPNKGIYWTFVPGEDTIDGEDFATSALAFSKLLTFSNGGGDGEWVAWSDVSMMPAAGKVPVFSSQGLLSTGMPLFPENAVPLMYIDLVLQRFLGVFDSESALNTAHPTGEVSQYAYVRDIDSTGDILRQYYWNDMAENWSVLNKKEDDIYSHEETSTGKIWYDGKPIFRQVFSDINIKDLSSVNIPINTISTNVTSISYILNNSGLIHSNHSNLNVRAQDSVIRIATSSQFTTETSITLIVEYTK